MTQYLPPNLLALFAPREPIPYKGPVGKLPWEKVIKPYNGIAEYVKFFEHPKDTPPPTRIETREERAERKRKERAETAAYKLEQDLALWDPHNDANATSDPYKTLFVARVNYDTSESKLKREFEQYGPIRKIHIVYNKKTGSPRGYAFIEYEHERDMHSAYKRADGKKIDGRRVVVDVERSRTVKNWRPRRLGGGLGNTRRGPADSSNCNRANDSSEGRDRSRSRSRRRRSRSRSRERRHRRSRSRDRRRRSRSRDRKRRRSRSRNRSRSKDRRKRGRSRENGAEVEDGEYIGDY